MCWGGCSQVCREELSLCQSIRCKLMLLFPERLGNRLRKEEWDLWDGHGTASSLMASAVARVRSQDGFWGRGITAPLGPGDSERETRYL